MDRVARSRTSSTSSLRSPAVPAPVTPSHTPARPLASSHSSHLSADQLVAGISRIRAERGGSRSSSIPATPAPTPNPLAHPAAPHMVGPEQLAAGISNLKVDEGYTDSASLPGTPAPSPYSPIVVTTSFACSPDQVAAGIQRLREESGAGLSGASTAQPPTPSTTPGPGAFIHAPAQNVLGVIPEHLAESINHLRKDEGLESGSNPGTPVPTPISPSPAAHRLQVHPEQLAAGIHRLKVEEGMSSGGSSGFPSTPAPTPFVHHPGGVTPEDLAAGISRLSVIDEGDVLKEESGSNPTAKKETMSGGQDPDLSQYFKAKDDKSFFDQINTPADEAVLHSCRESRIDLPTLEQQSKTPSAAKAELNVLEQSTDDEHSLAHRQHSQEEEEQPSVCTFFSESKSADPFAAVGKKDESVYATPEAVTPITEAGGQAVTPQQPLPGQFLTQQQQQATLQQQATPQPPPVQFQTQQQFIPPQQQSFIASTPLPRQQFLRPNPPPFLNASSAPITSPLPNTTPVPPAPSVFDLQRANASANSINEEDEVEGRVGPQRAASAWIPTAAAALKKSHDKTVIAPAVMIREDLLDPVRNLVSHYKGESEAQKRQVLTAETVTQDQRGLRQLVRAGCYRAAVNLTGRMLNMYGQGVGQEGGKVTPSSLQLWHTRLSLLVRLKQFTLAESEAVAFSDLNRPELYYETHPEMYPNLQGTMVPFAFRILVAELPQHLGKAHDTLDKLYEILDTVEEIMNNLNKSQNEAGTGTLTVSEKEESLALWKSRKIMTLSAIFNCAIGQKDFQHSIDTLELLLELETGDRAARILSALGRVYLQLGDLASAQQSFSKAFSQRKPNRDLEHESLVDMALLSMANGDYNSALVSLTKAAGLKPSEPAIINDLAVCYLYVGKLKEGLSYLEAQLTQNPSLLLQETPVLNLCTLYELESSYAGQKKRSLLDLVSKFKGDGIATACLKLQM